MDMNMHLFSERIEALVKTKKMIVDKFYELPPGDEESMLFNAYANLESAFDVVIIAEASQLLSKKCYKKGE
ncbi:MAG: hypothetical protein ACOX7H_06400 [Bacillota bacterium]|jgi:hypothetical protein